MTEPIEALILDLVEWVAAGDGEQDYATVMQAWRTSCPRLPVFEEALERGLLARTHRDGRATIAVTASGRAHLARERGAR